MKAKTIPLGFALLLISFLAGAQSLTVEKTWCGDKLTISIPRETNIFNYVIQAGNDTLNYEIIGAIPANGYSLTPISYSFTCYQKTYCHYRVKQIDMSGSCVAQMCGTANQNQSPAQPPSKSIVARDTFTGW